MVDFALQLHALPERYPQRRESQLFVTAASDAIDYISLSCTYPTTPKFLDAFERLMHACIQHETEHPSHAHDHWFGCSWIGSLLRLLSKSRSLREYICNKPSMRTELLTVLVRLWRRPSAGLFQPGDPAEQDHLRLLIQDLRGRGPARGQDAGRQHGGDS